MSNKEITIEEWYWLLKRIERIEQELNLQITIPRPQSQPKYGDITDLKFANEIIDAQRKTIKQLKNENACLRNKIKYYDQRFENGEVKNG